MHVERDDAVAKLWLDPVRLATSRSFNGAELGRIQRLVEEHEQEFGRRWREHFER